MIQKFHQAVEDGDTEAVVAMLSENPKLVNDLAEFEFSALHSAVSWDHLDIVIELVARGADVNAVNDVGISPLHLACSAEAVQILCDAGANVNLVADQGITPLFAAASTADRHEVVEALLKLGANPLIKNENGDSPLDVAKELGYDDVVQTIEHYSA